MLHDVVEILSRNAVNGSRCTVIGFGWRHQVPMCMRFTIVQIGEYSGANLRVGVRPIDHLCCEKNTDSRRASIIYEIKVPENLLSGLDVWWVSLRYVNYWALIFKEINLGSIELLLHYPKLTEINYRYSNCSYESGNGNLRFLFVPHSTFLRVLIVFLDFVLAFLFGGFFLRWFNGSDIGGTGIRSSLFGFGCLVFIVASTAHALSNLLAIVAQF